MATVWLLCPDAVLQAYVDTGSVREAAKRRCCSEQTIRHYLAAARARVGARNVDVGLINRSV